MTVKEAAARLGVSPSSVYALVDRRAIQHRRVLSRIVIDEADVADFLERATVPVAEPDDDDDDWTADGQPSRRRATGRADRRGT